MTAARPRVCHLISTYHPVVGGTQIATRRICERLVGRGGDVIVLTRRLPGTAARERVGDVPVYRAGLAATGKLGAATFAVHALWLLALELRGYRVLHVQNIDAPLLVGLAAKLVLRRRLVVTIHGETPMLHRDRAALGRLRVALMAHGADRFAAISPRVREELVGRGVTESRIDPIPNGVDLDHLRPPTPHERRLARAELGFAETDGVVLFVGRFDELKQVDVLLRAWGRIPSPDPRTLVLVGEGPEGDRLRRLAVELGLMDVRFEGFQPDVRRYLWAADVFVLSSRVEGLPVALLEAAATGVPAVVTDLPGNRAVLRDGESGLVAPVGDAAALAERLGRLLADGELRRRLGANLRREAERRFGIETALEAHERLYERAAERSFARRFPRHPTVSCGSPAQGPPPGDSRTSPTCAE